MNLADLRRIWFARQGLADPKPRSVAELVAEHGWLRTFGGNAYISCRARTARFARRDLDDAVFADQSVLNVPSVRSCVMLVPHSDAGLALRAALPAVEKATARAAAKCGFDLDEIETLGEAVVRALARGPATPDELRERLPAGKVNSLGEAGKKIGESSTLTVTLKLLTARGVLQRLPENDTVAASRLRYALFAANPSAARDLPADAEGLAQALVSRYLRWAAPATAEEIAGWSGLGKKAVAAALATLSAQELAVKDRPGVHFALPGDRFLAKPGAHKRRFVFVPADDMYMGLRADMCALLDGDPPELKVGKEPLLSPTFWACHLLLDAGVVIGAWDWHPERRCVIWRAFGKLSAGDKKVVDAEAKGLGDFIGGELGDLRMSSLDSLTERLARVAAIEGM
jgi:hypothetical protein